MNPFKKKKQRPVEELTVYKTTFVCEQDGIPERDFKQSAITSLTKYPHVRSAFLVRVEYDIPGEFNVSLCVQSDQTDDPKLKKELGQIFTDMFRTVEHLDIRFLREEQVAEVRRVCAPFYEN